MNKGSFCDLFRVANAANKINAPKKKPPNTSAKKCRAKYILDNGIKIMNVIPAIFWKRPGKQISTVPQNTTVEQTCPDGKPGLSATDSITHRGRYSSKVRSVGSIWIGRGK